MTIDKTANGRELTLAIGGRLDANTAPQLEAELNDSLNGVERLTLDLKELAYISSAGLRVLLVAQKRMNLNGSMRVVHVGEAVRDVFDITGFADILTIE